MRLEHEGVAQDYYLVSAPQDKTLGFCLRLVEGGALGPLLAAADPGQELTCRGPRGHFVFQPCERARVQVAIGTGTAPFVSMIRTGLTDFVLLQGVRRRDEPLYTTQVAAAAASYVARIYAAGPDQNQPAEPFRGRVTAYLAAA